MRTRQFYVYILMNRSGTLYVGMTNDLVRRVLEHRSGLVSGFTRRYRIDRLVYFEPGSCAYAAITREKQIKGWTRARKLRLIETVNPGWKDISSEIPEFEDPSGRLERPSG